MKKESLAYEKESLTPCFAKSSSFAQVLSPHVNEPSPSNACESILELLFCLMLQDLVLKVGAFSEGAMPH